MPEQREVPVQVRRRLLGPCQLGVKSVESHAATSAARSEPLASSGACPQPLPSLRIAAAACRRLACSVVAVAVAVAAAAAAAVLQSV